ncbi:hypothetical protein [Marinobacter daepoensis]|uniref:hypothetical protein n=1 Tax=Marinobacter daepoensis TaxID=262077 RepID=UPI000424E26F|nr:hypothetical protein [Marinobacter daepoensis]
MLETIDSAIKRLVSTTAMLVAAVLLTRGLGKPDTNVCILYGLIVLLVISAFVYLAASAMVAIRELEEMKLRLWQKGAFSCTQWHRGFVMAVS